MQANSRLVPPTVTVSGTGRGRLGLDSAEQLCPGVSKGRTTGRGHVKWDRELAARVSKSSHGTRPGLQLLLCKPRPWPLPQPSKHTGRPQTCCSSESHSRNDAERHRKLPGAVATLPGPAGWTPWGGLSFLLAAQPCGQRSPGGQTGRDLHDENQLCTQTHRCPPRTKVSLVE